MRRTWMWMFFAAMILLCVVMPCMAEEAAAVAEEAPGFNVGALVREWMPTIATTLVALGIVGWIRDWLKGTKLVRRLHAEKLIDVGADRIVRAVDKWAKKQAKKPTGAEKKAMGVKKLAEHAATEKLAATEGNLDDAIEAAHSRMEMAANFQPAGT